MNRARLAVGQTASNLLYLALNYYRAATDNGHGGVHGKRLNRTMDLDRPGGGANAHRFSRVQTRTREKRGRGFAKPAKCAGDAFSRDCTLNVFRKSLDGEVKRSDRESATEHAAI